MFFGGVLDDEEITDDRELNEPNPAKHNFVLPPHGIGAKQFVEQHFGKGSNAKNLQFRHGTTTVAFKYSPLTERDTGGIVVAVDSRASAGEYISSRSTMKILDVADRMVATMAGGAADCQFWSRIVAKYCKLYELREKDEITVAAASKYFSNVLYGYRNYGLSVGSMVAGIDRRGPAIFMVSNDGSRFSVPLCSVGSGSISAYGVLDNFWKPEMSDEEALKLGRRAIMHATFRDTGSGGFCNVTHITPKGKVRYPPVDVSKLYYEFADENRRDVTYEPVLED